HEPERRREVDAAGAPARILEHARAAVLEQERGAGQMERAIDAAENQVGEILGARRRPDALHQLGQDLARVVLLAEEAPVDRVEDPRRRSTIATPKSATSPSSRRPNPEKT